MTRAAIALSALALAAIAPSAAGAAPRRPVEVLFFLDTEDYTDPDTADSIKRFADLFAEEGVRAHFAVVGFLADQLERWGRRDVLDSLKPHLVGTQTLYHSRHPDICELTDVADFDVAYERVFDEERRAAESVRRATGCDRVWCAVPPGNSKSYAAFYAWADLGIPFVCDTVVWDRADSDIWYCNIRQVRYDVTMEIYVPGWAKNPPDVPALLDSLAPRRRVALYAHPHFAVRTVHWDSVNYNRTNAVPWGEWKPAPKRPEAETEAYFAKVRELVRALKADGRFEITDLSRLPRPAIRRDVRRDDLPTVKAALASSLGPLEWPGSWCVADVFQAVVGFLRGEGPRAPGKVYGFLSEPRGVKSETSVSRQELVEAARRMDVSRFLPASIDVGGREIGPADFLFAALDALTTAADRFTIRPRDQLGDLDAFPELKSFRLRGTWVHTPQLEDRYLSDRLRWQLWTLRREPDAEKDDLAALPLNNPRELPPVKGGLWALPEVADVNGDGRPDLYVSSPDTVNGCSWYFENRGDGVFRRGVRCPLRRRMGVDAAAAWNCPDEDSDGTPITDPRSRGRAVVEAVRADWDGDGDEDVVACSFTGVFFYYENTGRPDAPEHAPRKRLFEAESCMVRAVAADWDGDGRPDIVFGDENGHVSWARNAGVRADGAPAFEPPRMFLQEDGDLECNALAAPFAVDWDGDGDLDFVCGDSPGFLSFVENLSGPGVAVPSWALPRRFTAGGRPLRLQAGLDGSLLGQHERKFGYTSASVADWDGDGRLDLMVGDIRGDVTLFRGKGGGLDLEPGERLDVAQAWRCRPLMVDWNRDGLVDLVTVDPDGRLVFHERFRRPDGTLGLRPPEFRFVEEDGSPVSVNSRPRGHGGSGRRKFQFVDWDGDGLLDIVCSAWSADFRRQVGERDGKTVFAARRELCSRRLAGHETCPTAVDFARRGVPDLVIGAEDGRFYFRRNDRRP